MTETISLRIDKDTRKKMVKVCDELGLSLSTAFNMYAKVVAREKKIPLKLDLNDYYNNDTKKSMKNVIKKKNLSKAFNSVDELIEDLNA